MKRIVTCKGVLPLFRPCSISPKTHPPPNSLRFQSTAIVPRTNENLLLVPLCEETQSTALVPQRHEAFLQSPVREEADWILAIKSYVSKDHGDHRTNTQSSEGVDPRPCASPSLPLAVEDLKGTNETKEFQSKIKRAQGIIGYNFTDQWLLWEALQAAGEPTKLVGTRHIDTDGNKRLAIIGDAVIKLAIAEKWYASTEKRGKRFIFNGRP